MDESYQLLDIYRTPRHIYWLTAEAALEVLVVLLANLWSKYHLIVSNLLYVVHHKSRERRTHIDWAVEYYNILMNFLRYLSLDLNIWCISVHKEVGEIYLISIASIRLDINRRTLDRLHVPAPENFLLEPPLATKK